MDMNTWPRTPMTWRVMILLLLPMAAMLLACNLAERAAKNAGLPIQRSMEQADERILELFSADVVGSPTVVYRLPYPLEAGDVVEVAFADELQGPEDRPSYTAGEETYFYFVDHFDGFFFAHPVEFVFVHASTGEVDRIDAEWWPKINGEEAFITQAERQEENVLIRHSAKWLPAGEEARAPDSEFHGHSPSERIASTRIGLTSKLSANGETAAGDLLIINGVTEPEEVRDSSEEGVSQAKEAFNDHYSEPQEFDAADPSKGDLDQDGDVDEDDILDWLDAYGTDKDGNADPNYEGRNLTIFIIAHGSSAGTVKIGDSGLTRTELQRALRKLRQRGIRVKLIIQACYSGNFVGRGLSRRDYKVAVTSSDDEPTPIDVDPKDDSGNDLDPNPTDKGPEWLSGFIEDYNNIRKRLQEDPELRNWFRQLIEEANARGADVTEEELIIYAASITAREKDASVHNGFRSSTTGRTHRTNPRRYAPFGPEASTRNQPRYGTLRGDEWVEILIGRQELPEAEEGEEQSLLPDASNDTRLCDAGTPFEDPKVDILQVGLSHTPEQGIQVEVILGGLAEDEYSYAVVLFVRSGDSTRAFQWQVHAGSQQIGEFDPATFRSIPSEAEVILTSRSRDGALQGLAQFTFPPGTFTRETITSLRVESYHMPSANGPWTCDEFESETVVP